MSSAVRSLINDILDKYSHCRLELDALPSGVTILDVWIWGRCFELEYDPKQGVGVSELSDLVVPFTGHDHGFSSVGEGITFYKECLAQAANHRAAQEADVLHESD